MKIGNFKHKSFILWWVNWKRRCADRKAARIRHAREQRKYELDEERRRLFLLKAGLGITVAALCSSQANANTVFTSYAFPASGAPTNRTMPDRLSDIFNVKDYGALGNNSHDDTTNIQAAINAAAASGHTPGPTGGIVFFPPGTYKTTAALINNVSGSMISLIGSSRIASFIVGVFAGYIIDQVQSNAGLINHIEGLNIQNGQSAPGFDASIGAIRWCSIDAGTIANCTITGWTGIAAYESGFQLEIRCCSFNGIGDGGFGSVGAYCPQGATIACEFVGYFIGMVTFGSGGPEIIGCRTEVCFIGILAGMNPPVKSLIGGGDQSTTPVGFTAISNITWAAGVATVTLAVTTDSLGWTSGSKLIQVGDATQPQWSTNLETTFLWLPFQNATRTGANTFTYPLPTDPGVVYSGHAGFCFLNISSSEATGVRGYTTERDTIGYYALNTNAASIADIDITGTLGPGYPTISIVGAAGTATVTVPGYKSLDMIGWTAGTREITIDGSAFDLNNVWVTATRTSATTFTYSSAITGTDSGTAVWAFKQHNALLLKGVSAFTAISVRCKIDTSNLDSAGAGADLYTDGSDIGSQITLIGVQMGTAGWIMPVGTSKAGVQYINCDQPGGTTNDKGGRQSGMNFVNLPGESGVQVATAIEGMEFNIVNATIAGGAWGGIVTTGGSVHAKVRYNGTNWTAMGK